MNAPKDLSEARLAAGLFHFASCNTNIRHGTVFLISNRNRTRTRAMNGLIREEEYAREQAHRRKPPRHQTIYTITPGGWKSRASKKFPFEVGNWKMETRNERREAHAPETFSSVS